MGSTFAEFVGIRHVYARADRRLAGAGADHDKITAGVFGRELADVTARGGLLDFHWHGLHIGSDGGAVHVEEVEELVVLVEGIDDDADLAVGEVGGDGEFAGSARRPHRPADHLAE